MELNYFHDFLMLHLLLFNKIEYECYSRIWYIRKRIIEKIAIANCCCSRSLEQSHLSLVIQLV